MRHLRSHFLAGAISLLLLCLPAVSAYAEALEGQVIGNRDDPKASARVQFDGPQQYLAVTGPDGRFRFSDFVRGRYTITVRHKDRIQYFVMEITKSVSLKVDW